MAVKVYKPTTPSRRGMTGYSFDEITKSEPEKSLIAIIHPQAGRNNQGRITQRHQGAGHRRYYRMVDFLRRDKMGVPAKVTAIEYDPNRTARIALLQYRDGEKRYIIAPDGLKVGEMLMAGDEADVKVGNAIPLKMIPVGTVVHNIELQPGRGGQMARSAGAAVQLMAKEGDYAQLRMASGEMRLVRTECYATIGQVGNLEHENIVWGKAGRNRWRGIRPTVRGVVMNPCDHPHGGGEGKGKGGNHPQSPTGVPAKGYKTRKPKNTDWMIIRRKNAK